MHLLISFISLVIFAHGAEAVNAVAATMMNKMKVYIDFLAFSKAKTAK